MTATDGGRWMDLGDATDVLVLYEQLGGSKPLRRIMELAHRAGATTVHVRQLPKGRPCSGRCEVEWEAECAYLRNRYAMEVSGDLRCLLFGRRKRNSPHMAAVGCATLRPWPFNTVMVAVVPLDASHKSPYLTCSAECATGSVAFADTRITATVVTGTPFCEQERDLGSCAWAALKAASLVMSERFAKCKALTFPDISELAQVTRPSDGLSADAIERVLRAAGCDVITYPIPQHDGGRLQVPGPVVGGAPFPRQLIPFTCDELMYLYQESGLPVVLGAETEGDYHALLVVGHTLEPDAWWPGASEGYYPSLGQDYDWLATSLWVTHYYIHDDNFGPYMSVAKNYINQYTRYLFLLLPSELAVRMTPEHAQALGAYIAYSKPSVHAMKEAGNQCRWKTHALARQEEHKLVLRTLLVQRDQFLAHIRSKSCRYPPQIRSMYEELSLPPWVWLVEVTFAELFGAAMRKVGEILLDPRFQVATHAPTDIDNLEAIVSVHLAGFFWANPAESDEAYLVSADEATEVFSGLRFNKPRRFSSAANRQQ